MPVLCGPAPSLAPVEAFELAAAFAFAEELETVVALSPHAPQVQTHAASSMNDSK
jgi:hypothetical protein